MQRLLVLARGHRHPSTYASWYVASRPQSPIDERQWEAHYREELEGYDIFFDGIEGFAFIANVAGREALGELLQRHPRWRAVDVDVRRLAPLSAAEAEYLHGLRARLADVGRTLPADAGVAAMMQSGIARRWRALLEDAVVQLPAHPFTAGLLGSLFTLQRRLDTVDDWEWAARRLLEAHRGMAGPDNPALVHDWVRLAGALEARSRRGDATAAEEAEASYRSALALAERALPAVHPVRLRCLYQLGLFYERAGRHQDAADVWRQGLAGAEQSAEPDPTSEGFLGLPVWLNRLAEAKRALGAHDEAEQLLRRALAVYEHYRGPEYTRLLPVLRALAAVCAATGRPTEAAQLYERALSLQATKRDKAAVLDEYARVLDALGRNGEGASARARAAAIRAGKRLH